MKKDWIIDYSVYKETLINELEALLSCLKANLSLVRETFNTLDEKYRKEHYAEENEKIVNLKHKILSFEYLINYRKGEAIFVFPNGYGRKVKPNATKPKKGFFARHFGHRA